MTSRSDACPRLRTLAVASLVVSCSSSDGSGRANGGGSGGSTGGLGGASTLPGSGGLGLGSTGGVAASGVAGAGGLPLGTGGASGSGGAGAAGAGGSSAGGSLGAGGERAACPSVALAPGETNQSLSVGTATRTYIRHVPPGYTGANAVPLVVDFHPLFGTGALERGNSGYAALADQEGFIVLYPDGIDAAWNIGPCCTSSRTVDDLGFARALVLQIERDACIDTKRVYATGYSMGGGMSHYLACNAADVFAAVAPSAFDLLAEAEEPCAPSRPITVISFRGTADPIVPYAGGASNPPNGLPITIHFQGAQGTLATWAKLDGCTGTPTDAGAGCSTYSQCSAGTEVTLCTATGGGHVTGDAKTGWATLKRHSMP